jgi:hypothetical protein
MKGRRFNVSDPTYVERYRENALTKLDPELGGFQISQKGGL